jgi:adenylate kinase family enzyme
VAAVPRIVVLGTSGAGKTTVARRLAGRYGLAPIELDDVSTGPGWTTIPAAELRARVLAALQAPDWIVDGNYERALGPLVLERADTAVWLDLPLRVSLARMARRTWRRVRDRALDAHGNRERWRLAHLSWVVWEVRSHLRRRVRMRARLARHRGLTVVHLRSQREVDAWLGDGEGGGPQTAAGPQGPATPGVRVKSGQLTRRRSVMPGWMSHTIV